MRVVFDLFVSALRDCFLLRSIYCVPCFVLISCRQFLIIAMVEELCSANLITFSSSSTFSRFFEKEIAEWYPERA